MWYIEGVIKNRFGIVGIGFFSDLTMCGYDIGFGWGQKPNIPLVMISSLEAYAATNFLVIVT